MKFSPEPNLDLELPPVNIQMLGDAIVSDDGLYRYELRRVWKPCGDDICWILLNPSTADGISDDPTVKKVVGFSRRWGYGSCTIVNLFAWRATDPDELLTVADPVGPENDAYICEAARRARRCVLAWGAHPAASKDGVWGARAILAFEQASIWCGCAPVSNRPKPLLVCLGKNKDGSPKHPLYLPYETELKPLLK